MQLQKSHSIAFIELFLLLASQQGHYRFKEKEIRFYFVMCGENGRSYCRKACNMGNIGTIFGK
jgi:hypothetical protein